MLQFNTLTRKPLNLCIFLMLLPLGFLNGQTLSLASATGNPGSNVTLGVALTVSGAAPAGLQWTLNYSTTAISALTVTAGPAATSAGKTLSCASGIGTATCVLAGMNATALVSGTVAYVKASLAANATTNALQLTNVMGAAPNAGSISLTSSGGTITVTSLSLSSLTCSPTNLNGGTASNCTLALTQAAPSGGITVNIASNNTLLTIPASVTVAAGETTATFSATAAASIPSNQTATVTATFGTTTQTASVNLQAPLLVSAVACNPATLGQSAVSTCTVTLTQMAPAGGSSVTLSSNNTLLTVPASVTVAGGATTATFSATAAASIPANQTATVTAKFAASTQAANVNLQAAGPNISFIQSTSVSQPSGQQTLAAAFPGSVSSGDLIIVGAFVGPNATVTVTDNLGTVYAQVARQAVAGDHDADIFAGVASGSGADVVTINGGSNEVYDFSIHEYRGVTAAVDVISTTQGTGTAPASGSLTTTAPNDLIFAWFTNGNNYLNETFGSLSSAYTKREFSGSGTQCGGNTCIESGDLVASTILTTSVATTLSVSDIWSATVVAFKGATWTMGCSPANLGPGGKSNCTVTLPQAAPVGGTAITISSNNTLLTVPASVTVAAGATTATFSAAAAASIPANQTATVAATLVGNTQTAAISLLAPVLVSGVACNPASLGQSATSTCTVTLTQTAAAGGAAVTLASNNTLLTVPASLTVAAGATTATFSATAAASIPANQTATVTAMLGTSSKSASLTLQAPVLVSGVVCNPASLGQSATSTCTLTLTQTAAAGGAAVTVSSNNTLLTVPASVTVAAGATTATFTATAAASIPTNQTATVTATFGPSSKTTTINLQAAGLVSGVACNPTSLGQSATSTCTVTLTQTAAAGGAAVALSSNNTLLTVQASVTVAAGATTATFSAAAAASIPSNQTATVTATLAGSVATTSISLTAAQTISPLFIQENDITNGTANPSIVSLSSASTTGDLIILAITHDNQKANVSSITDNHGNVYTRAISGQSWGTNGTQARTELWYATGITGGGSPLSATVKFSASPTSFVTLYMSEYSGITALDRSAVHAAKGSFNGTFSSGVQIIGTAGELIFGHCEIWKGSAGAGSGFTLRSSFKGDVDESTLATSTGSYAATCVDSGSGPLAMMATFKPAPPPAGASTTSQITLTSAPVKSMSTGMLPSNDTLRSLSCSPKTATPGSVVTCELDVTPSLAKLDAQLSSDSDSLRVPNHLAIGANRERLTFQAAADPMAGSKLVTITASLGESTAQESVLIASPLTPAISAPARVSGRVGEPVNFTVRASDPTGLPVEIAATRMPSQADFDSARGRFEWTPSATQTGPWPLTFTANNSAGTALVRVLVSISAAPTLDLTAGLTCSPGAAALVRGQSLDSATRIEVNGQYAPPLYSSAEQVGLLCPDLPAGTPLSLTVETDAGKSAPITGIMKEASPRILRVVHPDSQSVLARDFTESSYPAQPGDEVVLLATGLGGSPAMYGATVRVRFGTTEARVSAVTASGEPGVYAVHVIVPDVPSTGDVSVELLVTASGGVEIASNPIDALIAQ
jgi:hypothetical protein